MRIEIENSIFYRYNSFIRFCCFIINKRLILLYHFINIAQMKRTILISLTAIAFLIIIVIIAFKNMPSRDSEPDNKEQEEMRTMEIDAENCMNSHNFFEAIRLFNELEERFGHSDNLCIKRSEAYGALGLYDFAIKDLKAIKERALNWIDYTKIGDYYRLAGEYVKAIDAFTESIKLRSNVAFPYYRRGWCNELMGNKTAAFSDYDKAIEVDDSYAYTYLMRGELLLGQGKVNEAKADFEKILELDFIREKGSCRHYALHFLGKDKEAEEWMSQLIELQPDDCGYYYDQACLYARMGRTSESIAALCTAIEKGYCSFAQIEHDDDLDPIREVLDFKALIAQSKERYYSSLKENGFNQHD